MRGTLSSLCTNTLNENAHPNSQHSLQASSHSSFTWQNPHDFPEVVLAWKHPQLDPVCSFFLNPQTSAPFLQLQSRTLGLNDQWLIWDPHGLVCFCSPCIWISRQDCSHCSWAQEGCSELVFLQSVLLWGLNSFSLPVNFFFQSMLSQPALP